MLFFYKVNVKNIVIVNNEIIVEDIESDATSEVDDISTNEADTILRDKDKDMEGLRRSLRRVL